MSETRSWPLDEDERAAFEALRAHNAKLLDHLGSMLIEACASKEIKSALASATTMLDLGADPNHFDAASGLYPLLNAVNYQDQAMVDLLLSRGGRPNAADDKNPGTWTLMHIASAHASAAPQVMVSLLAAGGDPGVVRGEQTAIDMALKTGVSPDLIHMMRSAQARHFAEVALNDANPTPVGPGRGP